MLRLFPMRRLSEAFPTSSPVISTNRTTGKSTENPSSASGMPAVWSRNSTGRGSKPFTELRGLAVKLGHAGIHFHITDSPPDTTKRPDTTPPDHTIRWTGSQAAINPKRSNCPDYGVAAADVAFKVWDEGYETHQVPYVPAVGAGWDLHALLHRTCQPSRDTRPHEMADARYSSTKVLQLSKRSYKRRSLSLNRHPDVPRFVTIACFNEWSEGHYLLPDNRFGYGMLNALGEAVGLQN